MKNACEQHHKAKPSVTRDTGLEGQHVILGQVTPRPGPAAIGKKAKEYSKQGAKCENKQKSHKSEKSGAKHYLLFGACRTSSYVPMGTPRVGEGGRAGDYESSSPPGHLKATGGWVCRSKESDRGKIINPFISSVRTRSHTICDFFSASFLNHQCSTLFNEKLC